MERPYILHVFTPGKQVSPFDINMAADAGYQIIATHCEVTPGGVAAMTQDAIFSRGPKGVARTGIFIGGRDALMAADMFDRAKEAMVPPFIVSLLADPSGAFTTAAAMLACVESALLSMSPQGFFGRRVVILGGLGPVGRIAGVMASRMGAEVLLSSRSGQKTAEDGATETGKRFGVTLHGVSGESPAAVRDSVAAAEVVLGCAAAGVQVLDAEAVKSAGKMIVAADLNAVPPEGIAGLGVMDDGKPLAGTKALGFGALAIGDIKYQTHQRLLKRMREAEQPLMLGFEDAFAQARTCLADKRARRAG